MEWYFKLKEKHPYCFAIITGAIFGTIGSVIFNIILLLARK